MHLPANSRSHSGRCPVSGRHRPGARAAAPGERATDSHVGAAIRLGRPGRRNTADATPVAQRPAFRRDWTPSTTGSCSTSRSARAYYELHGTLGASRRPRGAGSGRYRGGQGAQGPVDHAAREFAGRLLVPGGVVHRPGFQPAGDLLLAFGASGDVGHAGREQGRETGLDHHRGGGHSPRPVPRLTCDDAASGAQPGEERPEAAPPRTRPRRGGRSTGFDRQTYRCRNTVERCFGQLEGVTRRPPPPMKQRSHPRPSRSGRDHFEDGPWYAGPVDAPSGIHGDL